MARLWAKTVTFEAVRPGDQLPILVKSETSDTIAGFYGLLSPDPDDSESEEAYPDVKAYGDNPVPVAALCAYSFELLEKAFPITGLMASGGGLNVEIIAPVHAGDTITLTGEVVDKGVDDGHREGYTHSRVVRCRVVMENQDGHAVAEATARVCL